MNGRSLGVAVTILTGAILAGAQPYDKTHIPNKYVSENSFIKKTPDTTTPPALAGVKHKLPQPQWTARPDAIKCYWKAWEIAFKNLHPIQPGSGFVAPFIDPAFSDDIFMWDCGFMLMFGRYACRAFNFQVTLNNFYAKQHKDGFICRQIRESNGTDRFERFDPSSTGPNILPWTEWEYYLNFNDTARLREVFPPLLAFYQWFRANRTWQDGSYFASGWGCGMDNQPRLPKGYDPELSHGHMSWVDITLQEIYAGKTLIAIARRLHRESDVADIEVELKDLTNYVNKYMWDDTTAFYYDRFRDGSRSTVKSIAAYWALLANTVTGKNAERLIRHLENPKEFARVHRVPTLSADNPNYNPDGGYWLGGVWAPTNYMVLRGLTNYGRDSLAFEIALNHLNNVVEVFNQSGTLRENYAPDKVQGNDRKDFVGWTGLAPITVLFEYVFGLRPDIPNNTLVWDIRLTDEFGVKQYPLGKNGLVDLFCKKRKSPKNEPVVAVSSNLAFTLKLVWDGGSRVMEIKPNKQ